MSLNLCLDVGNTHIFGGVYLDSEQKFSFRYPSKQACTSDQLGIFFQSVLSTNKIMPDTIENIGVCSVVPSLNYSLRSAFLKYFNKQPFFVDSTINSGLKIDVHNPDEVGADRLATAIAAIQAYPNRNLIIVDFGTATTFDAITADKKYLSGAIMPGIQTSMTALYENASQLSAVNIIKPKQCIGTDTITNIQSGLYFGQLGAIHEIINGITKEAFSGQNALVIGTGGFVHLFEQEKIFHAVIPDLVLRGTNLALTMNNKRK